ncbi:MAG: OmpA family protein [Candidatus Muirbacterium halophilum]|nr:OmpA family protein [Candidatus Muirbacterium halophilum]MCK9476072.1 OmpA family protein [Candidatus Muirbacterium halophilum]
MARKVKCPPPGAPAWVLTFGDCMTLLLTFFVLLFSMSSIDKAKFEQIVESFKGAFFVLDGGSPVKQGMQKKAKKAKPTKLRSKEEQEIQEKIKEEMTKISSLKKILEDMEKKEQELKSGKSSQATESSEFKESSKENNEMLKKAIEKTESIQRDLKKLTPIGAQIEASKLEAENDMIFKELGEIQKALEQKNRELEKQGKAKSYEDRIRLGVYTNERGIVVRIQGNAFFETGLETWKNDNNIVLQKIGEVLNKLDRHIRVEGHTDDVPIGYELAKKFATNWELSAARATNVLRYFVEKQKLSPKRFSSAGYGEYYPVSVKSDDREFTEKERAENRRVDIIILNSDLIKD